MTSKDRVRFINIDCTNAVVKQVVQIQLINGVKKFVLISMENLKEQINNLRSV